MGVAFALMSGEAPLSGPSSGSPTRREFLWLAGYVGAPQPKVVPMKCSRSAPTALLLTLGLALSNTADAAAEPFLGEIMYFAGNFCPRGWSEADGSLISISSNSALFSLLGTQYGGDGRTTFALPDLRGRVVVAPGTGPGLSNYNVGQTGGSETVTLSTAQLPSMEVAVVKPSTGAGKPDGASGNTPSPRNQTGPNLAGDLTPKNTTIGGGQAHNNLPPYVAIKACIATAGTFPSRG